MRQLKVLAVADTHYINKAQHKCVLEERKTWLAPKLLSHALAAAEGSQVDVIVLLGDLVDNGTAVGALSDLTEIKEIVSRSGLPVIVVPGNHDGDPQTYLDIFGDYEGVHEIKGYKVVSFVDSYKDNDRCQRELAKMEILEQLDQGDPIIVVQHNPVYPAIESPYPYNLTNARQVAKLYAKHGVILSISGHYHPGISLVIQDGVGYITCPAICEEPHPYAIVTLTDKACRVRFETVNPH